MCDRAERSRAEQRRAEQSRAEQSRAEQSRAEQSRAEQSRAEQSRAEQSRAKQRAAVEEKARAVLLAREPYLPPRGMSTLADLYDPLTMPPALAKAHAELDHAVEKCYRPEPFHSDRERVEHLFRLYEQLSAPLLPATPRTRARRNPASAPSNLRPRRGRTPGLPSQELDPA